jgi:LysM repeat protein
MAYNLFIDGMLFPVAPSKIQLSVNGQNKTVNLINDGEINILKAEGLKEISFEALLPNVKYPFAVYPDGFRGASHYIQKLQSLKESKRHFQYILVRQLPNKTSLGSTNITCALESFSVSDEAGEGFDETVSMKLKEFKPYGTKVATISNGYASYRANRETENAPKIGNSYVVKEGDCLWKIAKTYYGTGTKYTALHDANKDKISNPNLIYPGQKLIIP